MNFFSFVFHDRTANASSAKGRMIMLLFRIADFCATRRMCYYIGFPYLVLNSNVVIRNYCTLRHCTTIGNKQKQDGGLTGSPVPGNYVDAGSNVCIIGDLYTGDHVTIGCGSVVTKSCPPNLIMAGKPAIEIKKPMEVIVA